MEGYDALLAAFCEDETFRQAYRGANKASDSSWGTEPAAATDEGLKEEACALECDFTCACRGTAPRVFENEEGEHVCLGCGLVLHTYAAASWQPASHAPRARRRRRDARRRDRAPSPSRLDSRRVEEGAGSAGARADEDAAATTSTSSRRMEREEQCGAVATVTRCPVDDADFLAPLLPQQARGGELCKRRAWPSSVEPPQLQACSPSKRRRVSDGAPVHPDTKATPEAPDCSPIFENLMSPAMRPQNDPHHGLMGVPMLAI